HRQDRCARRMADVGQISQRLEAEGRRWNALRHLLPASRLWLSAYEHTDRRSQLGWRHGDGADAVRLPETAPSRLPDRRAGARVEPADSRTHARGAPGPEFPAWPRRAGPGDPAHRRAGPAWSVRPGDPAA